MPAGVGGLVANVEIQQLAASDPVQGLVVRLAVHPAAVVVAEAKCHRAAAVQGRHIFRRHRQSPVRRQLRDAAFSGAGHCGVNRGELRIHVAYGGLQAETLVHLQVAFKLHAPGAGFAGVFGDGQEAEGRVKAVGLQLQVRVVGPEHIGGKAHAVRQHAFEAALVVQGELRVKRHKSRIAAEGPGREAAALVAAGHRHIEIQVWSEGVKRRGVPGHFGPVFRTRHRNRWLEQGRHASGVLAVVGDADAAAYVKGVGQGNVDMTERGVALRVLGHIDFPIGDKRGKYLEGAGDRLAVFCIVIRARHKIPAVKIAQELQFNGMLVGLAPFREDDAAGAVLLIGAARVFAGAMAADQLHGVGLRQVPVRRGRNAVALAGLPGDVVRRRGAVIRVGGEEVAGQAVGELPRRGVEIERGLAMGAVVEIGGD